MFADTEGYATGNWFRSQIHNTLPNCRTNPRDQTNTPAHSPNNSTASSQEPSLQVNNINFQPSDEEEEDLEGTDLTETKMILDDLMDGVQEPTLPRLSEEDSEVDMDKVFMEVDNDWSDDSLSESDSDNDSE